MKKKKKQIDSIKRIEDVQELLRKNNYDEEAISEFCTMVKPFYDFYDYMLETHKMDYDMVEKDSGKYSEELFDEYLVQMMSSEKPMKFMMEISADIMARYAEKYGYSDHDKVKTSLKKYTELMFISNLPKL